MSPAGKPFPSPDQRLGTVMQDVPWAWEVSGTGVPSKAGEQAAMASVRNSPTCTKVPVVSLKSSARRPSNRSGGSTTWSSTEMILGIAM